MYTFLALSHSLFKDSGMADPHAGLRTTQVYYTAPNKTEPVPWGFNVHDSFDLPSLTLKPSPLNLGVVPLPVHHASSAMAEVGDEVTFLEAEDAVLYHPLTPHAWGLMIAGRRFLCILIAHLSVGGDDT